MRPRYFSTALLAVAILLPSASHAENEMGHAQMVDAASYQTYLPENALGEPDAHYTAFFAKEAYLTLDMGEMGATGTLTLTYQLQQFGAGYRAEFLDAAHSLLATKSAFFPLGQTEELITPETNAVYRYVRLTSTETESWNLDAVQATLTSLPATENSIPSTPVIQSFLVKQVDDGNPNTTADAAVYLIGADGARHAFPNEQVYFSWFEHFNDVAFIDPEHLASYPLGSNVTMRPGTSLVKLTSDPHVYAVEPGGVLRWISNESLAKELYGDLWAKRVVDISETFFTDYSIGDAITSAIHPDGTVGFLETTGQVVYLEHGVYYTLAPNQLRFQSSFFTRIHESLASLYVDGGLLEETPEKTWPY